MKQFWMALALGLALLAPAAAAAQEPMMFDCQENFNCLVQAAITCTPAEAIRTTGISGSGMVLTATTVFEVRGMEGERCVYFQRTLRASMRFDDATFEQFVQTGMTRDQVRQEEAQYNARYGALATGQYGICRLYTNELMTLLMRVGNGDYVPLDEYRSQCEGPLFTPPAGAPAAPRGPDAALTASAGSAG
jgi:hypothetical protein